MDLSIDHFFQGNPSLAQQSSPGQVMALLELYNSANSVQSVFLERQSC